ncbi:hypothetical protein LINGRAHAP2_LOCUS14682 [Linum grandiflorum]
MKYLGRKWVGKRCEVYNKAVKDATNKHTGIVDGGKLIKNVPNGATHGDWGWYISHRAHPKKKVSETI